MAARPIDSPPGTRGPRAGLAYAAVLVSMFAFRIPEWWDRGAGAALLLGAGLLWLGRRSVTVHLGTALVPAAMVFWVLGLASPDEPGVPEEPGIKSEITVYDDGRSRPLTLAEQMGVPSDATRRELRKLLGAPPVTLEVSDSGERIPCMAYAVKRPWRTVRFTDLAGFCFRDGHLAVRRQW